MRVSSAADFELDWNGVGDDVSVLNISTEVTRHFPWWDMRNPCWRGELTDQFLSDVLQASGCHPLLEIHHGGICGTRAGVAS